MSVRISGAAAFPAVAALLMLLSGFAGLGYQLIWTQQAGIWLGHEMLSVLAVVAAFFGGLAVGSFLLAQRVAASATPLRWYIGCELWIAAWSLALRWLLDPAAQILAGLAPPGSGPLWHGAISFVGVFLLLLPATCAMGMTLPALERTLSASRRQGYAIGGLYAANTLGAMAGVLGAAFLLVPVLGLNGSVLVCVTCNLLCAVLAARLVPHSVHARQAPVGAPAKTRPLQCRPLVLLACTGMLGIGHEVLVVRVLAQLAENTVYTFAMLLAIYLAGTAAGAAAYQRWLANRGDGDLLRERLIAWLALTVLASITALAALPMLKAGMSILVGPSFGGALLSEIALALPVFLLPSVVMGALFTHLCVQAKDAGWHLGQAIGANTFGAALAPFLFGMLLLPLLGAKNELTVLAAAYLLLLQRPSWRGTAARVAGVTVLAAAAVPFSLAMVDVPPGGRLVEYREGAMASVSVIEDGSGVRRLHINNRQQEGSSETGLADARLAYLPLLLHPGPQRALFLGMGTGLTALAAAEDKRLQVDVVELLPEVVAASVQFRKAAPPDNVHYVTADARRYVRSTGRNYDVIVADLFHPSRSGTAALYTVEHFRAVGRRLNEGGVFCQWIALHQMDVGTFRSIVRAFLAAHPQAYAVLATNSLETPVVGLVVRKDAAGWQAPLVRARLADVDGAERRAALQLADEFSLLGSFLAGPAALEQFSRDAALNTDDRPVVAYRAPRATYAPEAAPRDRLMEVVHDLALTPRELLDIPSDAIEADVQRRLLGYWTARNRFLELGATVNPVADVRGMLAQVEKPLLRIAASSQEFRPAYDPLLNMAMALSASDAAAARSLLQRLVAMQPARREAWVMLQQLSR